MIFFFFYAHNLKVRPSWCPKALPCSLHILKKNSHWALLSDPYHVFQPRLCFPNGPCCWRGFHWGSYLAYWVFIFQHCFSLAFPQQLSLLPEFSFYVLDWCPYLIQLFVFPFGLFERSYHCSFEFSVWEMVQIILIEVYYWLGLVNIFVGNISSCFLFWII